MHAKKDEERAGSAGSLRGGAGADDGTGLEMNRNYFAGMTKPEKEMEGYDLGSF